MTSNLINAGNEKYTVGVYNKINYSLESNLHRFRHAYDDRITCRLSNRIECRRTLVTELDFIFNICTEFEQRFN